MADSKQVLWPRKARRAFPLKQQLSLRLQRLPPLLRPPCQSRSVIQSSRAGLALFPGCLVSSLDFSRTWSHADVLTGAVDAGALEAVGKHNVSGSSNISAYSAAQMSSSLSGLFSTTLPAVTPTPLPLEERDDIDAKVDAHVDAAHTIGTVVIESAGQSAPGLKWPPVPALSKSSYNDCTENGMPCAVDGGAVSNVEKAAQTMPPLAPAGLETYGLPTTLTTVAKPR